jgi:hypothetical protein
VLKMDKQVVVHMNLAVVSAVDGQARRSIRESSSSECCGTLGHRLR